MAPLSGLTETRTNCIYNKVFAIVGDDRFDYGEPRYRAYGLIDGVSYCLVFTVRNQRYRPISLRRAHAKEMKRHAPQA
jgi:uncharacterized DUF497 family protein